MDKQTFTKEESNILIPEGFAAYWARLWQNMTQKQAYELAEAKHMEVHLNGKRKYTDFSSFMRDWYEMKAKKRSK